VVLCNICWQDTSGDVETPAERTLIFKTSDDTDDFFRLDVCRNHATNGTDLETLIEAAEPLDPTQPATHRAVGRPRRAASVEMGEDTFESRLTPCPECGKTYKGKNGLAVHTRAKHPEAWAQIVLQRSAEAERRIVEDINRRV
jgi:hypothetical protein